MHADIHQTAFAGLLEIADAVQADDVRNFMGIANGCRHPARSDAAVEFKGRDQRAFDVKMCVDEPGHQGQARHINDPRALIFCADPDNRIAANSDIAVNEQPCHQIKYPTTPQNDIRRFVPATLRNPFFQISH